ncbi:ATP-binding protein [bacterium]|nr:ATP-binding protein [bacterium]
MHKLNVAKYGQIKKFSQSIGKLGSKLLAKSVNSRYTVAMKGYIKRFVEERLENSFSSRLITMVIGPRQVGKTTLLQQVQSRVEKKGTVSKDSGGFVLSRNVFTYVLDDIQLRGSLKKDSRYIQKDIELSLGETLEKTEQQVFIFIDEVQKMPSLFDWIKQVFDANNEHIKFVLSGSSALSITSVASETLAGRVEYINVYPFVYSELLESKVDIAQHFFIDLITKMDELSGGEAVDGSTDSILSQLSIKKDDVDTFAELKKYFEQKLPHYHSQLSTVVREATASVVETLFYGGLPRVITSPIDERVRMIKGYIEVYMEKEIGTLARNLDLELFGLSLQSFAQQNGSTLNINQVSKDVGISRPSLYKYLDLLENTYLIKKVYPYALGGVSEEATKSVVMYYLDSGILNNLSYVTSMQEMLRPDTYLRIVGTWLLSTILSGFSMLAHVPQILYWQNYSGHKIDLVFERGDVTFGILFVKPKDPRRYAATIEKFAEASSKNTVVIFLPHFDPVSMSMAYQADEVSVESGKQVLTVELPLQFLG